MGVRTSTCVLAVLAVSVGCGSVKKDVATDGGADLGDAANHDAPPEKGPVTVTFFYGDPVPDANVIIHDPTGAVVAEGTTGLDGSKRFEDVPRGSTLTIGKSLGNAPRVYTVVGIEPNDHLVVGERSDPLTTATITITASGVTADHFRVGGGCGVFLWDGSTGNLNVSSTCSVTPLTWNVVAVAFNASNQPLSYSIRNNVSGGASVTLSSWRTDWESFAVNWSNAPAGETSVTFRYPYAVPDPASVTSTQSSGTATFRYAKDSVNGLEYFIQATGTGTHSTLTRRIAPTASVTLDLGQELLPPVTSFAADLTDRTRPTLFWVPPSNATNADRLEIRAFWDGPGFYEWHVYARPDLPSPYQLPAIPASWGAIMTPPSTNEWTFSATVILSDDESKANWNDVRTQPANYVANRTTTASTFTSF